MSIEARTPHQSEDGKLSKPGDARAELVYGMIKFHAPPKKLNYKETRYFTSVGGSGNVVRKPALPPRVLLTMLADRRYRNKKLDQLNHWKKMGAEHYKENKQAYHNQALYEAEQAGKEVDFDGGEAVDVRLKEELTEKIVPQVPLEKTTPPFPVGMFRVGGGESLPVPHSPEAKVSLRNKKQPDPK